MSPTTRDLASGEPTQTYVSFCLIGGAPPIHPSIHPSLTRECSEIPIILTYGLDKFFPDTLAEALASEITSAPITPLTFSIASIAFVTFSEDTAPPMYP